MKGLKLKETRYADYVAARAFGNKSRKLEGTPAILHSLSVAKMLMALDEWEFVNLPINQKKFHLSFKDYHQLLSYCKQSEKQTRYLKAYWEMLRQSQELPKKSFKRASVNDFIMLLRYLKQVTVCAASLHDTLEDTDLGQKKIMDEFGQTVWAMVMSCTEISKKKSWQERKEAAINALKTAERPVKLIKATDKLDNLLSIEEQLEIKSAEEVWKKFARDLIEMADIQQVIDRQRWYYEESVKALFYNETHPPMIFSSLLRATVRVFGSKYDIELETPSI